MYSVDAVLDKMIYELDVIGRIERGKRVSTVDGLCLGVLDDTLGNSLFRTLHGDSRNRLLPFVEQKVQLSAALAERILESRYLTAYDGIVPPTEETASLFAKRLDQADRLIRTIFAVPKGLRALAETYFGDKNQVFQLQALANNITNTIVPPLFLSLNAIRERKMRWTIDAENRIRTKKTSDPRSVPPQPSQSDPRSVPPPQSEKLSPGETF